MKNKETVKVRYYPDGRVTIETHGAETPNRESAEMPPRGEIPNDGKNRSREAHARTRGTRNDRRQHDARNRDCDAHAPRESEPTCAYTATEEITPQRVPSKLGFDNQRVCPKGEYGKGATQWRL